MKKFVIVIILLICVGGGYYFYRVYQSRIEEPEKAKEVKEVEEVKKVEEVEKIENVEKIEGVKEEVVPTREEIMAYVASYINEISPEKGDWEVERFGFTSDLDVYVEYKDEERELRALLEISGSQDNIETKVNALFEPGADMWNLISGQDTQFGKKIEFYEKDEEGNWKSIHQF